MRFRDTAGNERHPGAVKAAMPASALGICSQLYPFVILGVGKRFVFALIPSPPAERPDVSGHFLLEIKSETILDPPLLACGCDVGSGCDMLQIKLHRLLIISHVGVI